MSLNEYLETHPAVSLSKFQQHCGLPRDVIIQYMAEGKLGYHLPAGRKNVMIVWRQADKELEAISHEPKELPWKKKTPLHQATPGFDFKEAIKALKAKKRKEA